jgi:hypothetical protein
MGPSAALLCHHEVIFFFYYDKASPSLPSTPDTALMRCARLPETYPTNLTESTEILLLCLLLRADRIFMCHTIFRRGLGHLAFFLRVDPQTYTLFNYCMHVHTAICILSQPSAISISRFCNAHIIRSGTYKLYLDDVHVHAIRIQLPQQVEVHVVPSVMRDLMHYK